MLPDFKTYYKHNKDSSIGKKRNKYVDGQTNESRKDLYRQIDA